MQMAVPMYAATRQVKVLDIASPGTMTQMAYDILLERGKFQNYFLKAFGNIGESLVETDKKTVFKKCALLEHGELQAEPSNFYDHVHFHAFNGHIGKMQMAEMVTDIHRMLQPGGYYFFSMDDALNIIVDGKDMALPVSYNEISSKFEIVVSKCIPNVLSFNEENLPILEANKISVGFKEIVKFFDAQVVFRSDLWTFVEWFSDHAFETSYFAIGKKK